MDIANQILSDITVFSKYAKHLPHVNRRETWTEIVDRNKAMHLEKFPAIADEIESAYRFVYDKRVLPSMRSLQFAGKPIELNEARIFNCSYLPIDDPAAFQEIMFLLLSGCGVGYSVQRNHVKKLPEIRRPTRTRRYVVADSIIGWADAVKVLMRAYFEGKPLPVFDFRDIRPKGARLVTSGGKAPGPEPLSDCLHNVKKVLDRKENGDRLTSLEVHDICCYIADAVLAGGIRRSATIVFFNIDDDEMATCKYGNWWELNPQRARANNSAALVRHRLTEEDFLDLWKKIELSGSGEPGIHFTNNASGYGSNPCHEIALKNMGFCNLTSVNTVDLQSQDDLNERVRAATFIGTLQAAYTNFHYLREEWEENAKNEALLGVSLAGIASGPVLALNATEAAKEATAENRRVAKLIGIKPAKRLTCVKPDGTVSLVLGCSSGVHAWHSPYYVRRMRVGKNEAIYQYLVDHHPELVEDDYFRPNTDAIIHVPQKAPEGAILRTEETAVDLLNRVKAVYTQWVLPGHVSGPDTHNVSCTVTIKPDEWDAVGKWMWKNRETYSGLSVLPADDHTYVQAPFEEISEAQYNKLIKSLHAVDLTKVREVEDDTQLSQEVACAGGACEIR